LLADLGPEEHTSQLSFYHNADLKKRKIPIFATGEHRTKEYTPNRAAM